jgi:predicted nucleic acid-binding protein
MTPFVVLDAAAFDVLGTPRDSGLRALLRRTAERGGKVSCAAVTLAEVCRGLARTRQMEAALARSHGGQRIRVVATDERLGKLVGAILHQAGLGSDRIADAHVVAVCAPADAALVLTEDPGDIAELAAALPGCRIVTRRPDAPL